MDHTTTKLILALTILLIAFILLIPKKKKISSEDEKRRLGKRTKNNKLAIYIYRIFLAVPILKNYLNKVETKSALLYPSDTTLIREKTANTLLKVTLTLILGVIVSTFMANGNLVFIIAGTFVALVLVAEIETNAFNKIENTINDQLIEAIDKITHNFSVRDIPDLALQKSIEALTREGKSEIVLHLKLIKDILLSKDKAAKIDEYSKTCPNRHLLTLLMIFASISEYGDVRLEKGESLFEKSLQDLKKDVQESALEAVKTKHAFSYTTYLCLVVVLAIRPLEMWATNNMPEVSKYYTGIYGVASMIGMAFISFGCYSLVITLRDGTKLKEPKTTSIFKKMSKFAPINRILTKEINKNYTKYEKVNAFMRQSGDRTGVKAYLTEKVFFSMVFFLVTLGVLVSGVASQRSKLIKDYAGAFEDTIMPSKEYQAIVEETAQNYSEALYKEDIGKEELTQRIKEEKGIKKADDAEKIAEEIILRKESLNKTYFQWYFLIISYLFGVIGFFIPNFMLVRKKEAAKEAMEEEILNYESLAIILMHVKGTTLETFLTWIKRFSYCFTPLISECQRNLSLGSSRALEDFRLKAKEEFAPLAIFIESLEEIDRSGVEKAFSSTRANMDYLKLQRRERKDDRRNKRANTANVISLIPLYGVITLQLLVPCILMVKNMYDTMQM